MDTDLISDGDGVATLSPLADMSRLLARAQNERRALELEIADLRDQLADRERRVENLRLFIEMYEHYANPAKDAPFERIEPAK